ncbi:MAG: hypothetical protein O2955_17930 [Planctomycetota bacterium]|nr:hypothetical protein [Planctomycetota bacterium]MDA1214392.1 hypothetical protein [Planctomycetota bacterium]
MARKGEKRHQKELKRRRRIEKKSRERDDSMFRQKKTNSGNRRSEIPKGYSTSNIKTFSIANPFFSLTEEDRCEFVRMIANTSSEIFDQSMKDLCTAVLVHNPLDLLATASFYCLMKGLGPDTDFTDDGPYPQAAVEVLQSFCLRHKLEEFGPSPVLHPHLFHILDLTELCSKQFGMRRMGALADCEPSERNRLFSIEGARLHTQVLRNWGYPQHMRRIIRGLFTPFEGELFERIGIGPIQFLELTDKIAGCCCERASELLKTIGPLVRTDNLRNAVRKLASILELPNHKADELYRSMQSKPGTSKNKRMFLLSYFHYFLPDIYTFTLDELCGMVPHVIDRGKLERLLDQLSFSFGDLRDENPEHLLMQSKIRHRPIIRIDDGSYFIPVVGTFNSFIIDLIESWIIPDSNLKEKYFRRRAMYLEEELALLLKSVFSAEFVRSGTLWNDPGQSSKCYENDCLVVCGPFALVFEAKSDRVDNSAKRGGEKKLEKNFKSLIQAPAEQASRFANYLESCTDVVRFETTDGDAFDLDLSQIQCAISISVTLDSLPAVGLCWKKLVKSGFALPNARPAISLTLCDLITVIETLKSPDVCLHYFKQRIDWETRAGPARTLG